MAAIIASLLVLAWLVWGRGPGLEAEATEIQRQMLGMDLPPRERKAGLAQLMRHVDKLDMQAQQRLRDEVRQEWRDVQRKDMDAYFAAAESERQAALDRAIDRLQVIAELDEAFTPGNARMRGPRPEGAGKQQGRGPRAGGRDPGAADRRKALAAYASALEKRARERGIDFSPLRRRFLRG